MDAKEPLYVVCRNGVFFLPDSVFDALAALVSNGFLYLRQDAEVLTISTTRIVDGYRRVLTPRFRAPMFRSARALAIVHYPDSVRVMAVR